jgi:hypothetical protein
MSEGSKKTLFFEKKQQTTFAPLRACVARTARSDDAAPPLRLKRAAPRLRVQSFFAAFCSQKDVLAFFFDPLVRAQ